MKQSVLLIFAILILQAIPSFGQVFFSHDTVSVTGQPGDAEVIAHAYFKNNSAGTLQFKWVREEEGFPSPWMSAVCDNNTCYAPFISSNINVGGSPNVPVVLAPGDSSILDVHLYPNNTTGDAVVTVCVSAMSDPDVVLGCITYIFEVGTSSTNEVSFVSRKVYPNPATDYFGLDNCDGISSISVYNVLGRKMRTYKVALGKKYYVGDLPAGLYLASLNDEKGDVVKTIRLVKRLLTP